MPFLVWGYTTVGISLFNYFINITGSPVEWSLTWFLIPVVGLLTMRLFPAKKSTEPRTVCRMTDAGRDAFAEYVAALETYIGK